MVSDAVCIICRQAWTWIDGTYMYWTDGWLGNNRPNNQPLAVLTSTGWDDVASSALHEYICKKMDGMY